MQVIATPDPLGGIKYTSRETGKSLTIAKGGYGWIVFSEADGVGTYDLRSKCLSLVETLLQ